MSAYPQARPAPTPSPAAPAQQSAIGLDEEAPGSAASAPQGPIGRRRGRAAPEPKERGVISAADRHRPVVRWTLRITLGFVLISLVIVCLGPLVWSARAAVSDSQTIISDPLGIFFGPLHWENLSLAWNGARIGRSLGNTVILALGSTVAMLVVCVTASYVLSVLRPVWGPVLHGAILVTMFLPGVVSLVPMYLTILDMPVLHISLLDSYWAVWLPSAANAFNIIIMKRFFDSIPRELIDAAKVDGAGPLRVLWTIIVPLSRPIIGVVALLSVVGSWKEFLWPMLALPSDERQPVSVMLPKLADGSASLAVSMAAVFLSIIIPVVLFIIFQKQFLRGVGAAGGIKG